MISSNLPIQEPPSSLSTSQQNFKSKNNRHTIIPRCPFFHFQASKNETGWKFNAAQSPHFRPETIQQEHTFYCTEIHTLEILLDMVFRSSRPVSCRFPGPATSLCLLWGSDQIRLTLLNRVQFGHQSKVGRGGARALICIIYSFLCLSHASTKLSTYCSARGRPINLSHQSFTSFPQYPHIAEGIHKPKC